MKKIDNTKKSSFVKKLFVKLSRLIGFEIILKTIAFCEIKTKK
jgi:hypothetical protein